MTLDIHERLIKTNYRLIKYDDNWHFLGNMYDHNEIPLNANDCRVSRELIFHMVSAMTFWLLLFFVCPLPERKVKKG